jgi:diguanylate cyclase (GGDEF)-like protein
VAPEDIAFRLRSGLAAAPVGYALFDPDERLRDANEAFLGAFDIRLADAPTWEQIMRQCHATGRGLAIATDNIDAWIARVRRSHRRQPVRTFESDFVDGRWMWVTESLQPDGWLLIVFIDVTALKASEATLRRAHEQAVIASHTDALTGLYNRRFMTSRLQDLLASAVGMRIPLAVAAIDLDHFKRINDEHGHAVGDRVLQHFAAHLRRHLRPLDVAGRHGGEEFLLLLPNAKASGAQRVIERLRRSLAASAPCPELPELRYTFSSGIAQAAPGDNAETLFIRADLALYRAKSEGRDRDVIAVDADPVKP